METLCITINFLDSLFHGQGDHGPEWPPSPFRLFQALLAASSRNGGADHTLFEWLERLSPPEILAPAHRKARAWITYVPNNDSDVKHDRQDRLVEKVFSPVRIIGSNPVYYLWSIDPRDREAAMNIATKADTISALGWGIDLVAAHGKILSRSEKESLVSDYSGDHWRPAAGWGLSLRCPMPGSLADLLDAYDSCLHRFKGNVYMPPRKPKVFDYVAYARVGAVRRETAAFRLLDPDDDSEAFVSFDQRKAMEIAAWVRGYLCSAAKKMGFPGDSEVFVAGHVDENRKNGATPPRFSYLPVPSIGHKHADGRIRRFIVAEPYGGDGSYAQWARKVLSNAVVIDKHGRPQARLQPLPGSDSVISRYLRDAETFQTVTPVVLPGYDDMKYSKAKKLFVKALEHAGFSVDDLAEPVFFQKAPFFSGGFAPRSYARPAYLKGRSAMHVRLRMKEKICGPLAVGAGRHFGLGLFAPLLE